MKEYKILFHDPFFKIIAYVLPIEPLVDKCEKQNQLHLLAQFFEHLESIARKDVHIHVTIVMIINISIVH